MVKGKIPYYTRVMVLESFSASRFLTFIRDDRGQGLVEYALIIATVSIVAIAALNIIGKKANNSLNNAASDLK
jgi:Flp pilus assembly pilin Flp